jgi:hypothetical protein
MNDHISNSGILDVGVEELELLVPSITSNARQPNGRTRLLHTLTISCGALLSPILKYSSTEHYYCK